MLFVVVCCVLSFNCLRFVVVRCALFVVRCLLFVDRCSMVVVSRLLFHDLFVVRCLSLVIDCSLLFVICDVLFGVARCCLLFVVLVFVVRCSLFVVRCSLFVVGCLLMLFTISW